MFLSRSLILLMWSFSVRPEAFSPMNAASCFGMFSRNSYAQSSHGSLSPLSRRVVRAVSVVSAPSFATGSMYSTTLRQPNRMPNRCSMAVPDLDMARSYSSF